MKYDTLRQFAVDIDAAVHDKYLCDRISFIQVNTLYLLLPKQHQDGETMRRIIMRGYSIGINIDAITYLVKSLFHDVQ